MLTDLHQTFISHLNDKNLTGQVVKTENDPFAFGGFADIWRGRWVKKDSGELMEVWTTSYSHFMVLILISLHQVAVRVSKGSVDDTSYRYV
jgi:hypothetical protein